MTKFEMYRTNWPSEDALKVARAITESIHQSFEGWTETEKKTIESYLDDIALACTLTEE